jgi:hypothetical protein
MKCLRFYIQTANGYLLAPCSHSNGLLATTSESTATGFVTFEHAVRVAKELGPDLTVTWRLRPCCSSWQLPS